MYEKTKICYIWKKIFEQKYSNDKNYRKVKDLCHCTGKCRSAAHNICDIKYSGKVKQELRVTSSNPPVTSSNLPVTSSNLPVTSSNPRVTSSNPRVRRLKAQVARLKARVGKMKARVRRLKARVEAIKPRVK